MSNTKAIAMMQNNTYFNSTDCFCVRVRDFQAICQNCKDHMTGCPNHNQEQPQDKARVHEDLP